MEVALIGGAPSSRHRIDQLDNGVQRWSLGMCYRFFSPYHLWFECHNSRVWEDTWDHPEVKQHLAWLRSCPVPVMMREDYGDVPGRVAYPEEEVLAHLGQRYHSIGEETSRWEYITGGPNWMLAYAIWHDAHKEKIDKLYVIGINMDALEEYFFQKSSFEHLLGMAMAQGIDVYIPPESPLLKGELYGTKKPHESVAPFEMVDLNRRQMMGDKTAKLRAVEASPATNGRLPLSERSLGRLRTLASERDGAVMVANAAVQVVREKVGLILDAINRELQAAAAVHDVDLGDNWEFDPAAGELRKKEPAAAAEEAAPDG